MMSPALKPLALAASEAIATKVTFGPKGIEKVHPIGKLNEYEQKRLKEAEAQLKGEIETGLAYAEQDGPGFYLHTWTEIAVDDVWRAVDPTFGNTRIGPTHVRFPMSPSGYLRAYAAIPDMRFEVIDAEYRASP